MAHVQKRCRCAKTVPARASTCPSCGSKDFAWRARYRAPDGHEKSKTFERRIDAERWLSGMQVAKGRGDWVDPALGRITLAAWSERWIDARAPILKPKTIQGYRSMLRSRILPAFGRWQLASIGHGDVQAWINGMRSECLSASRIRQAHVQLSMMFKAAVREGLIARNPAVDADLPRIVRREAAYLDPADVERIAASMPEPYDLLVRIMGNLGLRYGEAVALRRRSVDLLRPSFVVEESLAEVDKDLIFGPTKSHAVRRVPLPAGLAQAVADHLDRAVAADPDALLFTTRNGAVLRHSNFYHRRWRPALRAVRLPATKIQTLRHSAAAAWIRSGASPKVVQQVMGHATAGFTLTTYGHVFDSDMHEAAARLNALLPKRGATA